MDLSYAPMKTILVGIVIAIFVFAAGCSDNCLNGEDKNINVSVVENNDIQTNMGFTYHHNVTLKIENTKNSIAKSVKIFTYYCNEIRLGQQTCENRTLTIGDIPPSATVIKYFEYDRALVQDQTDGTYHLRYRVESCLPITTINNSVYAIQR
jgi:hypothetical protein